ncbi:tRNA A58 N-methylase Trm61 [Salirhabdus euzebyi]|uniref:tRNA A58 N-methylase Trm61 n=1 Tax=Salirhabdus euzebyi TaxID=394506 RepID=A0A841Q8V0_9BACI|nr:hypothetical protein [Salirhabdus euzebyi]MBB6454697.1 tRNA A58 N-methylase Trm61 [Salirhabdus euzebyi]
MLGMGNKNKLKLIIWLGVGSAILTSVFSSFLISKVIKIYEKASFIEQELFNLKGNNT